MKKPSGRIPLATGPAFLELARHTGLKLRTAFSGYSLSPVAEKKESLQRIWRKIQSGQQRNINTATFLQIAELAFDSDLHRAGLLLDPSVRSQIARQACQSGILAKHSIVGGDLLPWSDEGDNFSLTLAPLFRYGEFPACLSAIEARCKRAKEPIERLRCSKWLFELVTAKLNFGVADNNKECRLALTLLSRPDKPLPTNQQLAWLFLRLNFLAVQRNLPETVRALGDYAHFRTRDEGDVISISPMDEAVLTLGLRQLFSLSSKRYRESVLARIRPAILTWLSRTKPPASSRISGLILALKYGIQPIGPSMFQGLSRVIQRHLSTGTEFGLPAAALACGALAAMPRIYEGPLAPYQKLILDATTLSIRRPITDNDTANWTRLHAGLCHLELFHETQNKDHLITAAALFSTLQESAHSNEIALAESLLGSLSADILLAESYPDLERIYRHEAYEAYDGIHGLFRDSPDAAGKWSVVFRQRHLRYCRGVRNKRMAALMESALILFCGPSILAMKAK